MNAYRLICCYCGESCGITTRPPSRYKHYHYACHASYLERTRMSVTGFPAHFTSKDHAAIAVRESVTVRLLLRRCA